MRYIEYSLKAGLIRNEIDLDILTDSKKKMLEIASNLEKHAENIRKTIELFNNEGKELIFYINHEDATVILDGDKNLLNQAVKKGYIIKEEFNDYPKWRQDLCDFDEFFKSRKPFRDNLENYEEIYDEEYQDDYSLDDSHYLEDIQLKERINDYLTVILQNRITKIYVAGNLFRFATNTMLNLDEIKENCSRKYFLPEENFREHVSILKTFVQYKYNTDLIHPSIAFPLLKELYNIGDPTAIEIFRNEIFRKFSTGSITSVKSLLEGEYFLFLDSTEFDDLMNDKNFIEKLDQSLMDTTSHIRMRAVKFLRECGENGVLHIKQKFSSLLNLLDVEEIIEVLIFLIEFSEDEVIDLLNQNASKFCQILFKEKIESVKQKIIHFMPVTIYGNKQDLKYRRHMENFRNLEKVKRQLYLNKVEKLWVSIIKSNETE